MEKKYTLLSTPDASGKSLVRRESDGKTARCKPGWLELADGEPAKAGQYRARSKTKAIRLDGLEWTTEG